MAPEETRRRNDTGEIGSSRCSSGCRPEWPISNRNPNGSASILSPVTMRGLLLPSPLWRRSSLFGRCLACQLIDQPSVCTCYSYASSTSVRSNRGAAMRWLIPRGFVSSARARGRSPCAARRYERTTSSESGIPPSGSARRPAGSGSGRPCPSGGYRRLARPARALPFGILRCPFLPHARGTAKVAAPPNKIAFVGAAAPLRPIIVTLFDLTASASETLRHAET